MDKYTRIDFRDQIARNKWKSFFLMFVVFVVLIALGWAISMAFSPEYFFFIMILAIIFSVIYITVSFYNSDKIAIASVGAEKINSSDPSHKMFRDLVEGLTLASGLPMPKLFVMPMKQINAFASGRDPKHAVVCVSQGALDKLDRRELEGVLAHELGHIGNYDMRYMTLVAVMVGMVAIISEIFLRSLWFSGGRGSNSDNDKAKIIFLIIGIALAILAPIVVYFVQLSISRKHEYSADATAVKFTRYPQGLIGALKKIKSDYGNHSVDSRREKKPSKALAPIFFANPFKAMGSTHPPIDKRIDKLQRM